MWNQERKFVKSSFKKMKKASAEKSKILEHAKKDPKIVKTLDGWWVQIPRMIAELDLPQNSIKDKLERIKDRIPGSLVPIMGRESLITHLKIDKILGTIKNKKLLKELGAKAKAEEKKFAEEKKHRKKEKTDAEKGKETLQYRLWIKNLRKEIERKPGKNIADKTRNLATELWQRILKGSQKEYKGKNTRQDLEIIAAQMEYLQEILENPEKLEALKKYLKKQ